MTMLVPEGTTQEMWDLLQKTPLPEVLAHYGEGMVRALVDNAAWKLASQMLPPEESGHSFGRYEAVEDELDAVETYFSEGIRLLHPDWTPDKVREEGQRSIDEWYERINI